MQVKNAVAWAKAINAVGDINDFQCDLWKADILATSIEACMKKYAYVPMLSHFVSLYGQMGDMLAEQPSLIYWLFDSIPILKEHWVYGDRVPSVEDLKKEIIKL